MRPDGPVASHHFEALGTSCSLFAGGQSRTRLLEGEFWVRRLGARLTRFSTDSELSRLNRNAGQWTGISDEMEVILRAALHAHEMSAGLVNAAVLPSMLAVGYTRPFAEGPTVLRDARTQRHRQSWGRPARGRTWSRRGRMAGRRRRRDVDAPRPGSRHEQRPAPALGRGASPYRSANWTPGEDRPRRSLCRYGERFRGGGRGQDRAAPRSGLRARVLRGARDGMVAGGA